MTQQASHPGPRADRRIEAHQARGTVLGEIATSSAHDGSAGCPAVTTTALLAAIVVMLIACVTVYGGGLP